MKNSELAILLKKIEVFVRFITDASAGICKT
jgi:hypothetical protein